MMLYVLSCGLCEFSAEATDIRGFGLQLITHGSRCDGDPVVVLADCDREGRSAERISPDVQPKVHAA
jgi:hypothetical protein